LRIHLIEMVWLQTMSTIPFEVHHVSVESTRSYDEVTRRFLEPIGKLDPSALATLLASRPNADEVRARLEAMAGPSGLILLGTIDHGALLSALGHPQRAVQYSVGNPLTASRMTRHHAGAGLYAPLRVLIRETDGHTFIDYDQPSSLFGRLGDARIDAVAAELDRALADVVRGAV
jgi:uncharacterized protein (DUF302 family)